MSWAADLQRLTTKGGRDLGQLCKEIKIELFSGVVSDTRVQFGMLRGNWQIQENMPSVGTLDRLDPTGEIVQKEIKEKSTKDGLTYFTNNLPYARVYEEKDAMVATNVIKIKQVVKELAAEVKG